MFKKRPSTKLLKNYFLSSRTSQKQKQKKQKIDTHPLIQVVVEINSFDPPQFPYYIHYSTKMKQRNFQFLPKNKSKT